MDKCVTISRIADLVWVAEDSWEGSEDSRKQQFDIEFTKDLGRWSLGDLNRRNWRVVGMVEWVRFKSLVVLKGTRYLIE